MSSIATRLVIAFAAVSALPACTSLASVSVTQIPADRSRPVSAEVSNTAFLGIHFDNDFVDELTPELLRECPHGRLTGILTKHQNTSYVIVSTRKVIATGYCVYDPPLREGSPPEAPPAREGG